MVSIDAALARIKREWAALLEVEHIEAVCRAVGLKWRRRVLDPVTTTLVFFLQVLHRNTAMTNLPRLAGRRFTAGAYCQARQRLPLEALQRLLRESGTPLRAAAGTMSAAAWRGQRIFLLDGSSCSMPDTRALQRRYGQPGGQARGCGFPVAHLLLLVEADTGLILDVHVGPLRTHDLRAAAELHPYLQARDILLADRGFCSYGHVAALWRQGVWVVFRLHQRLQLSHPAPEPTLEQLIRFGPRDALALWHKPRRCPLTMRPADFAALPETLIVRLVEYSVRRAGYRTRQVRLLTTLLDPQRHSVAALAELYGLRWQIETDFRHLKQTLGLDVLRCRTPDIVEK